jgi:uncharacterized RDD family membrane protein YckC
MSDYGAPPPPPTPPAPPPMPGPGHGAPTPGPSYADMGQRLLARIVDWVLVGVAYLVIFGLFFAGAAGRVTVDPKTGELTGGGRGLIASFFLAIFILSIIGVVYEVVLIALRGATVGKKVMGIKVVREQDGGIPGWGPSLLRWVVPLIGSFVCGIGQLVVYLSPFFDNTRRYQGESGSAQPARGATVGPLLLATAAVAGTVYVGISDPNQPGHYPTCPFLALTGWYCPGCGGLRAIHALAHGQFGEAVARNALLVGLLPLAIAAWGAWLARSLTGRPRRGAPVWLLWTLITVAVAFGILRNLPGGAALAP